jgi:hypothetical protein
VASESVRQELVSRRLGDETKLRERFERATREGDIPSDCDTASLASYVLALAQGMALQASMGMSHKDLRGVVDMALKAWPCGPTKVAAA